MCKAVKILALLAISFVLMLFVGCDASIELYEAHGEDGWHFTLNINVSQELENKLHGGATHSDKHDGQWTLNDWLYDYFVITSELYGYEFKYDVLRTADNRKVYSFHHVFVPNETVRKELSDGLTYSGKTDVSTNLFIRTINVVRDDRFNFWIRSLEDAVANGQPTEGGGDTLMAMILYGVGHYDGSGYVEDLPGFTDAFGVTLDGYTEIMLTDFWLASVKMNVADARKVPTTNSKNAYYVFDKQIGDSESTVMYEYYRADPTGWYLVAIAAGGAAVGLGFLAAYLVKRAKNRKPKPTAKDFFPYDPFDGNIDPFA